MRSDLLALPACRLGGGVKIGFARKDIDPSSRPVLLLGDP
jgi:hypothetical protein